MLPKISETLFVRIVSPDHELASVEYKSRIADMEDGLIHMEVPLSTKDGKLLRLFPGDRLSAYYVTNGGVKHHFYTEVTGFREDAVRLVTIKAPSPEDISKSQRRNYLRMPADLDVAVRLHGKLQVTARTEDVGGGGLSFICDHKVPVKEDETITGWLLLQYRNGSIDHMAFPAKVVRLKPLENGSKLVMCSFTDISEQERQKVIRYCFERQLEFRKQ